MTHRNTLIIALTILALMTGLTHESGAQDVNYARLSPGTRTMHLSVGLDPALVTTVGTSWSFDLGDRPALVDVDFGLPVADADFGDARFRIGVQAPSWITGDWRIALRGRLIARRTQNTIYEGASFAADLTTYAGFYRRGWFIALMGGYDRTAVMHLKHTDWYRDNFYGDAVDGWYRGNSGIIHGGLVMGVSIGGTDVAMRMEMRRTDGGEPLDPPIVGGLTISRSF